MRRIFAVVVAAWVASGPTSAAHATEAGIDVGWVVANGEVIDAHEVVDSIGVDWVRINFRLDAWSAPDDPTPRGSEGVTWMEAYDRVVDAYVARGYQVYGLLNDEAVASPNPPGSEAWIADFVRNAVVIVDHFKDRVRTFEVINEPNNWIRENQPRLSPRAFAQVLQDTYLEVKHHAGHADDRCWQVDLVSGALFSFDGVSAADYLAETFAIGRGELAWDWTREHTGRFPLDGIGYHLYVAQGADSSLDDLRAAIRANLDDVHAVVAAHDDAPPPFWISEYGFRADAVGADGQADRLAAGFDALAADGRVAAAMYFTLSDFPDNLWGVFDGGGQRRPSADRLGAVAAAHRPAHGAAVLAVAAPPVVAGALGEVVVTVENRGAATWTANTRLAAAPGCPEARAANELAWQPADGYSNGVLDARVRLPHDVAPGETVELHVPVRAPDAPGTYRFAARMVEEGEAFFGATALADVAVLAGEPAPSEASREMGGCNAGGGASGATALFGIALLACGRRRRRARD